MEPPAPHGDCDRGMKISILIDDRSYEFERSTLTDYHYASSIRFCPRCCRTWATIQIESERLFWPVAVSCERCQWHTAWKPGIPGSLLEQGIHQHIDLCLLDSLPRPLLEREFRVHLKAKGISLHASPHDKLLSAIVAKRGRALNESARESFEPIVSDAFLSGILGRNEPPLRR